MVKGRHPVIFTSLKKGSLLHLQRDHEILPSKELPVIISASRRTDIPAFYGQWLLNRLKAGEVLVRNPLNRKQVSAISLKKENVDCFVFWTKDPGPFLPFLDELDSYNIPYYFSITITAYGRDMEKGMRRKKDIVDSVKELSSRIGVERVIWRYDPILFTEKLDTSFHLGAYESLAGALEGSTEKCIFSFLSEYGKIGGFIRDRGVVKPDREQVRILVKRMSEIAMKRGMTLASCALTEDFSEYAVEHNSCVDPLLIEKLCGYAIQSRKDKSQRGACGCAESRDLGTYNTCLHGCLYCYANRNPASIRAKAALYNPDSPMLCDSLEGDERVRAVSGRTNRNSGPRQISLF